VLAHELAEAATDPLLNAWYTIDGSENADKCLTLFPNTKTLRSGAKYNMKIKKKKYL